MERPGCQQRKLDQRQHVIADPSKTKSLAGRKFGKAFLMSKFA
jgi:hypothetical protein